LKARNILVTGVSSGLGLEVCKHLLHLGNTVYGISRNESAEWKALQERYSTRCYFKSIDLAHTELAKDEIFSEDYISFGTVIHGFVSNAAIAYDDIITNIDLEVLKHSFDVNVFTPMLLTKYVIRHFLLHKVEGSIVHISSVSTKTAYKGLAMYASTKGSMQTFSLGTAREWGKRGIRSNCVLPGFMETAMTKSLSEEQKNKIYARTALKQETKLADVAEMVSFLLSDKASSITGQNISVDSGTI